MCGERFPELKQKGHDRIPQIHASHSESAVACSWDTTSSQRKRTHNSEALLMDANAYCQFLFQALKQASCQEGIESATLIQPPGGSRHAAIQDVCHTLLHPFTIIPAQASNADGCHMVGEKLAATIHSHFNMKCVRQDAKLIRCGEAGHSPDAYCRSESRTVCQCYVLPKHAQVQDIGLVVNV